MATLNNPITAQNIIDRFADYVTATANAGITWGTDANPTHNNVEFIGDATFGGTIAGRAIGISGPSIVPGNNLITAANIYSTLVNETNAYTAIRNLRARRILQGDGGATTVQFDQTNVAYMTGTYSQSISIGTAVSYGLGNGSTITSANLETFFDALRTAYNTARATTQQIDVLYCHSSCHAACHGSRSRR